MSDSQHLPPYSGEGGACPKCGCEDAETTYLSYGRCIHGVENLVVGALSNERLHRECARCRYSWDEATVADSITRRWS